MGLFDLFKVLLPTGRAYSVGQNGDKYINGTVAHLDRAQVQIDDFTQGVLPNQPGYGGEWLARHERILDIPVNPLDTVQTRIQRVIQRMRPSDPMRSLINIDELQAEIDEAGWNGILYIHENPQGLLPEQILPQLTFSNQLGDNQLGDDQLGGYDITVDYPELFSFYQLGDYQLNDAQLQDGPVFNNKIANYLNRHRDTFVNLQPLAHTFVVCGPNFGDIVTLPASDEIPLRQLLLNIKPASSVGFLLIKYV